jgi:hypothetical protein
MRKIGTTGSMAPQLTILWPRSKSTSLLRCSVRRELRSFSGYRSLGHRAVLNPGPQDSRSLCSRIFRSELALFYSLSWINSSENAYCVRPFVRCVPGDHSTKTPKSNTTGSGGEPTHLCGIERR